MKYKGILFDMDGTLFDTERLYKQCWMHAGVPEDVYYGMIGRTTAENDRTVASLGLDPKRTRQKRNEYLEVLTKDGIPKKPSVDETLQAMKARGFKIALATANSPEAGRNNLERTGILPYFDAIASGSECKRGKPFPDIFLLAAEKLGIPAEECMVVEDSFGGVRAGRAAGMYTIMIPDQLQPDEKLYGSIDALLTSLREVPALADRINEVIKK